MLCPRETRERRITGIRIDIEQTLGMHNRETLARKPQPNLFKFLDSLADEEIRELALADSAVS